MNWSDEQYVKVYKRETLTILSLDWDARCVLRALLLKLDGAGVMETGTMDQAEAIALQLRAPVDVVKRALPQLIACGTVIEVRNGILLPNFVAAQEATKTERLKKADQRQREADQRRFAQTNETTEALVPRSPGVSRAVPLQPSPAQPSSAHHQPSPPPAQPSAGGKKSKKPKQATFEGVVPPKPKGELELLVEWFATERDLKITSPTSVNGLAMELCPPDEPTNWGRLGAAVAAWKTEFGADGPQIVLRLYLESSFWAGATRRDSDGKDTGEAQPYPLNAVLSEKVWRRVVDESLDEGSTKPAGGVH